MDNLKYLVSDEEIRALFTAQNKRHEGMTAAIAGYNLDGYPCWGPNIMSHGELNRLAARNGMQNPDYASNPLEVYSRAQREMGCDFVDQWLAYNPLSMAEHGYEHGAFNATTGPTDIIVDGMAIEEPEDVVEHMEKFAFPQLQHQLETFDMEERVRQIGLREYNTQMEIGLDLLKTGYEFIHFPVFDYFKYGYENYFCAYLLYQDVIDRHFDLQSKLARKNNEAAVEAYKRYNLPKLYRLDHDLTDSRSTLVDIKSMDRIWFPRLAYSLEPILQNTDVRLIWHCDGNIMPMVPRLLEIGIRGFQGFQYEDGVDFAKLCKLRGNDGQPLFMIGGVSVTRTLPHGTPADVRREMDYLVEVHGDTALALGCSSSVAPGVPSANIDAMIEGFRYYKNHRK